MPRPTSASVPAAASGPAAVLLFSGGLDSTTVLAMARAQGFAVHALSVAYGQRHDAELQRARALASRMGAAAHKVVSVDIGQWGGSSLTSSQPVPAARPAAPANEAPAVPSTYVPARNTVFLSLALAWAEVLGAFDLFIGANAVDYSGYPDCRPDFLAAFAQMANMGTAAGRSGGRSFVVHAPLMQMSKAQIVLAGQQLGVDYAATLSCYDPRGAAALACGRCEACALRRQGFAGAGVVDPTCYAPSAPGK